MAILDLQHPYRMSVFDLQTGLPISQLLVYALAVIVTRAFPNGMAGTDARLWARIEDKLLVAAEPESSNGLPARYTAELDGSELDWLARHLGKIENVRPHDARAAQPWTDMVDTARKGD